MYQFKFELKNLRIQCGLNNKYEVDLVVIFLNVHKNKYVTTNFKVCVLPKIMAHLPSFGKFCF